jgi:integrase
MPACPFSPTEILTLESHRLRRGRYRDRMLLIAGTQVGYRITELLTWTVGQVLGPDGDIVREVTVTRADLKGGKGVRKRSVRSRRVMLNDRATAVPSASISAAPGRAGGQIRNKVPRPPRLGAEKSRRLFD